MFFINGLGFGTTTVAIPQLRKEANSTSAVSDEMASWICKSFKITYIHIWCIFYGLSSAHGVIPSSNDIGVFNTS